jgi:hypothetical protein
LLQRCGIVQSGPYLAGLFNEQSLLLQLRQRAAVVHTHRVLVLVGTQLGRDASSSLPTHHTWATKTSVVFEI